MQPEEITDRESLEAWLTGPRAAELINNYAIDGETLFVFNAVAE